MPRDCRYCGRPDAGLLCDDDHCREFIHVASPMPPFSPPPLGGECGGRRVPASAPIGSVQQVLSAGSPLDAEPEPCYTEVAEQGKVAIKSGAHATEEAPMSRPRDDFTPEGADLAAMRSAHR